MAAGNGLLVIERILRDRPGIWRQIFEERDLRQLTGRMFVSSAICLAAFGAVLGASHGWQQALASAVKLPILFLVTLVICLPTLYLFNLVFGARLSIRQAVALVAVTVTVLSTLSLAFAPISLFFLVTAPDYSFYKLLNVAIMMLTALVGLRFIVDGMRALNRSANPAPVPMAAPRPFPPAQPMGPPVQPAEQPVPVGVTAAAPDPATQADTVPQAVAPATAPANGGMPHPAMAPAPRPVPQQQQQQASMKLLYVWIVVFGFVGTQLAWTLRPFFGSPGEPFEIFRKIEGNFYVDIVHTLGRLF